MIAWLKRSLNRLCDVMDAIEADTGDSSCTGQFQAPAGGDLDSSETQSNRCFTEADSSHVWGR